VPNAYFLLLFQLINASAPGNQPTEGLIRYFHSLGIETDIEEQKVHAELYPKIPLTEGKGERS